MGFEPVEGGGDTTSAGTLLVVAYLVMWALLVGFIWLSWRRVARVESRIGGLERALESGRGNEK
jgi:CcmD family protein